MCSSALNFEETSRTIPGPNNSERQETYFILYRDGFMLLVMGYTGKKALAMKLAYIEAFNRMEEELARQKEAARNITQDIVDFPGTLSITPSSVADRKPLRALVGSWAKLSNAPFDACWNQLKAASSSPASGTCRRNGYRTRWRGCRPRMTPACTCA